LFALQQRSSVRTIAFMLGSLCLLLAVASPAFSNRWLGTLEDQYPSAACTAEAKDRPIVALAGGFNRGYSNLGLAQRLSNASKNRVIAAAQLTPPGGTLIFSGGSIRANQRPKEATAMAALGRPLLAEGVQLQLETRSEDTYSNATETAQLFEQLSLSKDIVLVTSASHMPRAAGVFTKQGFTVCAHAVDPLQSRTDFWRTLLPRVTAIPKTSHAIHEWIGYYYYAFRGWL